MISPPFASAFTEADRHTDAHPAPGLVCTARSLPKSLIGSPASEITHPGLTPFTVFRLLHKQDVLRGHRRPRSTFSRHIVQLTLLLATGGVTGCGQPNSVQPISQVQPPTPLLIRVERHFRVFRGPSEKIPHALNMHLKQLLAAPSAERSHPRSAQRVDTPDGVAWIFLNGSSLCLAQGGHGALACSTVTHANREGVSLGVFAAPSREMPKLHDFLLLALVPDGIQRVEITVGRQRQSVGVQDNVISASGDRPVFLKRFIRNNS